MLRVFLFITASVIAIAFQAQAITWEFDREGDAQGWAAWEHAIGIPQDLTGRLPFEVNDGIWRILPAPSAGRLVSFHLVSPRIGHDSELFDRIAIRFRVVLGQPFKGYVKLMWTNPHNQYTPRGFRYEDSIVYEANPELPIFWSSVIYPVFTTDWQEVVFDDLRPRSSEMKWFGAFRELSWEGELIDFQLTMEMSEGHAEAVEIERIVLTGVEEQLQGELAPPEVEGSVPPGTLFSPPVVSPLDQLGVGQGYYALGAAQSGSLGDLDGDGDLDLLLPWKAMPEVGGLEAGQVAGWGAVFQERAGRFGPLQRQESFSGKLLEPFYVKGADFDRDGRMDLLVGNLEDGLRWLHNDAEQGWVVRREFPEELYPMGLADVDGDGDVDLLLDKGFYLNDGSGHLATEPMVPSFQEGLLSAFLWVYPMPSAPLTGVLWRNPDDSVYKLTYLEDSGAIVETPLAVRAAHSLIRYAGDLDGDGDVDLVVGQHPYYQRWRHSGLGLDLLRDRGDGSFETRSWLPEVITVNLRQQVVFLDLNGDPWLDPVVIDANERQQRLLVFFGRAAGLPELEGGYPISGVANEILSGDVDGDGAIDLMMVDGTRGHEEISVWLNQGMAQSTAVGEAFLRSPPARFQLGASYPNPFNPQTWIPIEIPGDGGFVDLRIYNVLGQPIRTLVAGRLTPGHHLMPWDGRDAQGQPVPSGTYFYRLKMGNRWATGKMVKEE